MAPSGSAARSPPPDERQLVGVLVGQFLHWPSRVGGASTWRLDPRGAGRSRRTARPRWAVGPCGGTQGASTLLGMFVRYYVEMPLAAARVEEALVASPPGWLSDMAGEAQARGDELLTAVGAGPLGPRLGQAITLSQPGGTARMRS